MDRSETKSWSNYQDDLDSLSHKVALAMNSSADIMSSSTSKLARKGWSLGRIEQTSDFTVLTSTFLSANFADMTWLFAEFKKDEGWGQKEGFNDCQRG